jgi:unsaturated rhamnogalacturonyl hydrolase
VRKGYLPKKYLEVAEKAYSGYIKNFIKVDSDGLVTITNACAVAGLGGTPYRSGTYSYYIGEKKRNNDPKAVGPFIMASVEMERLSKSILKVIR